LEHRTNEIVDFKAILKRVEIGLDLSDILLLTRHERLCFACLLLNSVEEKVDGGVEVLADLVYHLCKLSRRFWLLNRHAHFFACLDEEEELALSVIAQRNTRPIGQVLWLHVPVHVDEMSGIHVTEGLDYAPRIVLWNCNPIQFHTL